ncbi:hypothetical protein BBK82_04460 [Lentzea guizhouensis]|uniref:Translation initiation factor IF-2 N-terminal domain-containing protein n=1 Tax=Lentzea guizhouensis TaxID=1586287 RepID=A0A1B2HCI5_9PSEU|nr:hypothetical protein BBK82_04460 [Lentzea guizhouensis]
MSNTEKPAGATGGQGVVSARPELADLPDKLRVHALAKLLDVSSKDVMTALADLGEVARSAQSSVSRDVALKVAETLLDWDDVVTGEITEDYEAPAVPAFEAPALAPVFAAPSAVFLPPTPIERPKAQVSPFVVEEEPEQDEKSVGEIAADELDAAEAAETDVEADADGDDDSEGRRRRRRGRRGRGRGKGGTRTAPTRATRPKPRSRRPRRTPPTRPRTRVTRVRPAVAAVAVAARPARKTTCWPRTTRRTRSCTCASRVTTRLTTQPRARPRAARSAASAAPPAWRPSQAATVEAAAAVPGADRGRVPGRREAVARVARRGDDQIGARGRRPRPGPPGATSPAACEAAARPRC